MCEYKLLNEQNKAFQDAVSVEIVPYNKIFGNRITHTASISRFRKGLYVLNDSLKDLMNIEAFGKMYMKLLPISEKCHIHSLWGHIAQNAYLALNFGDLRKSYSTKCHSFRIIPKPYTPTASVESMRRPVSPGVLGQQIPPLKWGWVVAS